jgi:hypothetical protein
MRLVALHSGTVGAGDVDKNDLAAATVGGDEADIPAMAQ